MTWHSILWDLTLSLKIFNRRDLKKIRSFRGLHFFTLLLSYLLLLFSSSFSGTNIQHRTRRPGYLSYQYLISLPVLSLQYLLSSNDTLEKHRTAEQPSRHWNLRWRQQCSGWMVIDSRHWHLRWRQQCSGWTVNDPRYEWTQNITDNICLCNDNLDTSWINQFWSV